MELSVMNETEKNHAEIDKIVEKSQRGTADTFSPNPNANRQATLRRIDPAVASAGAVSIAIH
jgi:hypothetical protein